ncbi:putative reverse transcriptase domain-containing protein [Tanacetum coccineum]
MINEGVTAALAARNATRNGDDSHTLGTGVRRPVQVARECTYSDFLKCQPLNFKGTEGSCWTHSVVWKRWNYVYSYKQCTVACKNQQTQTRDKTWKEAYAAGNGDRRHTEGTKPMSPPNVNTGANQRACFECGAQGHFKKDCPKLKNNNNWGNQARNAKAQAKVVMRGQCGGLTQTTISSKGVSPKQPICIYFI